MNSKRIAKFLDKYLAITIAVLLLIAGFLVSCSPKVSASKTMKSSYKVDSLSEKTTASYEETSIADILKTQTKDVEETIVIDVYDTNIVKDDGSNPISMRIVKNIKSKEANKLIEKDSSRVSSNEDSILTHILTEEGKQIETSKTAREETKAHNRMTNLIALIVITLLSFLIIWQWPVIKKIYRIIKNII